MTGKIKTTSFSRLQVFEQCPRRAFLQFVQRIPEPERPGESPADRGSRLHLAIEDYICGKTDELSEEIEAHRDRIEELREAYKEDHQNVLLEESWHFDEDWNVCEPDDWDKTKIIMKLDVFQWIEEDEAIAIDWKSGRKHGNEVKHADQLHLYQLGAFLRYPHLERVHVVLYYIDKNESTIRTFTREQGMRFLDSFGRRLMNMLEEENFMPKPSLHTCRFCPYKTGTIVKAKGRTPAVEGTGDCNLNPV